MTLVNFAICEFVKKKQTILVKETLPIIKCSDEKAFKKNPTLEYICIDLVFKDQFDDERCLFMIKKSIEGFFEKNKYKKTVFFSKKDDIFFNHAKKVKISEGNNKGDFFALSVLAVKT